MHDVAALSGEQGDLVGREMHAVNRDELRTGRAEVVQPMQRRAAVLGEARRHFVRGLGEMGLDRQVELARVDDDLLPGGVAHGVRRVRRQREREPLLVLQRVADLEAARQVGVGVRGVGRGKVEHRQSQHRAHAQFEEGARARVRKEIHVVAAGDPAAQHFGRGETGAVVDEVGRHEAGLARPDVPLEPDLQRHVVGDAAEEAHRRVRVGVDEARQQHVARHGDMLARREAELRLRRGDEGDDAPGVDDQRVAGQARRRARSGTIQPASRRRSQVCMGGA